MFCSQCGAESPGSANFCPQCGSSLAQPDAPNTGVEVSLTPETPAPVEYAGFWRRFAAYIIDYIIILLIAVAASLPPALVLGSEESVEGIGYVVGFVVFWLYYALMEGSTKQATLGKMALGIKVTDLQGRRISFGRATGRQFAKVISALTLLVGYIMAGFTAQKQALHDIIAATLVVKKEQTEKVKSCSIE